MTADVLARDRILLLRPVDTAFHTDGSGSTGIAIAERFGDLPSVDRFEIG